jgi:cyclic pyranopterin phosphate synthase
MPADRFPQGYAFIPPHDLLTFDEIARLTAIFSGLGVHKIRLTGGEPLMRPHLDQLVARLASIDGIEDIALSTNGYLLPKMAAALRSAGLKRLNISLDSLDDAVFRRINGDRASAADVLRGIDAAERAGFSPLKINTVVQRGINDQSLIDLVQYFRRRGHIVRFIEYMDVGTVNGWNYERVLPTDDLIRRIAEVVPLEPIPPREAGEVARRYRCADAVGGEIGFITAVSKPFCGGCNRLRLSAEGKLYRCLFANHGLDVRGGLRSGASDAALTERIASFWQGRDDRYSEARGSGLPSEEKVEMYHIGG